MDEICLFKIKDKDLNKWMFGSYDKHELNGEYNAIESLKDSANVNVNMDTFCEYTGFDDINNNEIFINDIVLLLFDDVKTQTNDIVGRVVKLPASNNYAIHYFEKVFGFCYFDDLSKLKIKVIGNMYG